MSEHSCFECGSTEMLHNETTKCQACGEVQGGERYTGKHKHERLQDLIQTWHDRAEETNAESERASLKICSKELEAILNE